MACEMRELPGLLKLKYHVSDIVGGLVIERAVSFEAFSSLESPKLFLYI